MHRRILPVAAAAATLLALLTGATPARAASDGDWDYRPVSVSGSYQTFVANFAGDGADDILWYAPGSTADSLWTGHAGSRGAAAFTKQALQVGGTFKPVVGDFAGDAYDDIIWYAPGSTKDYLWVSNGNGTFTSKPLSIGGTFTGYRLRNYLEGGKDDVFWYTGTNTRQSYWWRTEDTEAGTIHAEGGTYASNERLVVGDWNGDGLEDLFFHGPGNAQDFRIDLFADGSSHEQSFSIGGTYVPVVVYDYPNDGILFFGPGAAPDAFWRGRADGFKKISIPSIDLNGRLTTYPTGAVAVTGRSIEDALFIGDNTTGNWYYLNKGHEKGDERLLIGDWDDDGAYDVLWYAAGSAKDEIWYLEPSTASADTSRTAPEAQLPRDANR